MRERNTGSIPIGRLSSLTGVKVETIRYYERVGLLRSPPRTEGGHRSYDDADVRKLAFVRRGRQLGFTLDEIRTLLDMVAGGRGCGEMRDLALDHAGDIRRKIDDLGRIERTLRDTAARCQGGNTPECPIIDELFGEAGPMQPNQPARTGQGSAGRAS